MSRMPVAVVAALLAIAPGTVLASDHGSHSTSSSHSGSKSSSSAHSSSTSSHQSGSHSSSGHAGGSSHSSRKGSTTSSHSKSTHTSSGSHSSSHTSTKRDPKQREAFTKTHPCPSTGKKSGACPGYVVDHVVPLKRGGADSPSNMQWQTTADAKSKDKWE